MVFCNKEPYQREEKGKGAFKISQTDIFFLKVTSCPRR